MTFMFNWLDITICAVLVFLLKAKVALILFYHFE